MTDRELAQALTFALGVERETEGLLKADDLAERDQAVTVYRLVKPLRQKLETWISVRALRAQLTR